VIEQISIVITQAEVKSAAPMKPAFDILGLNLVAALLFMVGVWLLSLVKKNASIVDVFWGLGFVLMAWLTYTQASGYPARQMLLVILTSIWGLRLSFHILVRNWGKGEDRRYQNWRAKQGERFWWVSLFTIFGTQALLLWVVSLVVQIGQLSPVPGRLTLWDSRGVLVWGVGFMFEAAADWQLARFKADPDNKGKVMNRGLWAYTRHPNYFGETLIWWGLFLITFSIPYGYWAIISPFVITFLLLKVSGVTLLEQTITKRRPEYRDYINNTSPFIPWFPKGKKS
jgi:steroid 5-alpha reductase family enzyme